MLFSDSCINCGSKKMNHLFDQPFVDPYAELLPSIPTIEQLKWYKCSSCGLAFRNPVPSSNELSVVYNSYEKGIDENNLSSRFERIVNLPHDQSENKQKLSWLFKNLGSNLMTLDTVVDVGCGGGMLLYSLNELQPNLKTYGIEQSPEYAKIANKNSKALVYAASLEELVNNKKSWDIVLNTKVLEHILDPFKFLEGLSKIISPHGFLFLEVPHYDEIFSLSSASDRFYLPHLYFFPPSILRDWARILNLSIISERKYKFSASRSYYQMLLSK